YIDPQWNVAAGLLAGATLVILDGFHPSSFWARVREHRVTYFYCLGAMPALHATLEERWNVPWYEAFGMTETGSDLQVTDAEHDELVGTGSLGRPVNYRQVRIVDPGGRPVPAGERGEITLAGGVMMDGYYGDPEATARVLHDGWFHTGDLGWMDPAGRVYYAGRLKDMIRRSGENVAAGEVEEVLLTYQGIRLAAVTGVPDDLRGEEVKAYYVAESDAITPAGLAAYCAERLAAFKVPRFWQPAADLPRTDSERVAKQRLRDLAGPVFDLRTGTWRTGTWSTGTPNAGVDG